MIGYKKTVNNGTSVVIAASTRRDEITGLRTTLDKQGYAVVVNQQANVHTLNARKTA